MPSAEFLSLDELLNEWEVRTGLRFGETWRLELWALFERTIADRVRELETLVNVTRGQARADEALSAAKIQRLAARVGGATARIRHAHERACRLELELASAKATWRPGQYESGGPDGEA
jgi:hypothetical protein